MKKLCSLFSFILLSIAGLAQKGSVRGIALDTLLKQPVAGCTISVLEKKDSSLVSFTMTGDDGRFEIKGIPDGDFRLLVSHINYHNSNIFFTISEGARLADLGNIIMNDVTKVLAEVILSGEAPPVTLINDTIQYNAGSFKVQPNGSVEQLLKKLPGLKVEKDGTIKAQGEKVTRVLVDGKEFFGDDPKMATKNLPADAIDKVQVYDKQSDQAQLTGFEDGNYEKTINLKLKKDKKKGAFGKLYAGAGNKDRYEGRFNVNSFKGARQLSAIGLANNTNAEGFSFMDILNFTGELGRMQRGNGNININITPEDAAALGMNMGGNSGGINRALAGGLNYNNIIGTKLDLQSNYFYNRLSPVRESHIQREFIGLPLTSSEDAYSINTGGTHRINANLLYQVDSMNSLRIIPSFNSQKVSNRSAKNYQTLNQGKPANGGYSESTFDNDGYTFRNEVSWRKKFARKGRTFSLSLQTSLNESNGEGALFTANTFYQPNGSIAGRDTVNQRNFTKGNLRAYNLKAVYTEPLGKRSLLEVNAGVSDALSISKKMTYDYNEPGKRYDLLNEVLSNNFENRYDYVSSGLRIRTQRKKYNYTVGVNWQQAGLTGTITSGIKDSVISKSFTNLLPNARFQYNFTKYRNINLTYSTTTNQPSITQLQPVPDNSNPLNISEGNPDLRQEFNHLLQVRLMLVSPYKNRNLFAGLSMHFTGNKIVNYDSVNIATGVRKTRPVNVDGVYNLGGNLSYSMPVSFIKGNVEFSMNSRYARTTQLLNNSGGIAVENAIRTVTLGPDVRLDMNFTDKLNITVGAGMNYTRTKFSLDPSASATYLTQDYSASFDWEMPKGFFFSTDFNYLVNSQRATGFNSVIPVWNASISKQMLKFNRGELKFSARDLLDRNIGITRNTNNNYIEDMKVLTLRQFFLVSFTYSLSKTGLSNSGGGRSFQIR